MEFITDFNIEFHRHLMHLYFQWKKLFYEELSDYTFAAKELDEEKFSLLLLDTTKALIRILPAKYDDGLYCWEDTIKLLAYLRAFSEYPTVTLDPITLNFDTAKAITNSLLDFLLLDRKSSLDIFKSLQITIYNFEDDSLSKIPYKFDSASFTAVKKAIMNGGTYDMWDMKTLEIENFLDRAFHSDSDTPSPA